MTTYTTFFFYDLETCGTSPKDSRIMQFAGQRTDMDLNPVGEPFNILICLTDDILPDPFAITITGITPQQTITDGITELEFLKIFYNQIAIPGTIFVGFNNLRFDDEFIRFLNYRNFFDAYEWHWKDDRSRWDLLDVVRMTRALRPNGINWPVDPEGKPTNRLELLTKLNYLDHQKAHDALSDVYATISVAKLIKQKQPKLFDYLLNIRNKKAVSELVTSGQPFAYTSGRYPSEYQKTTVVYNLGEHPKQSGGYIVFDLRIDPKPYLNYSKHQLQGLLNQWDTPYDQRQPIPFKALMSNKCPAIAPVSVIDSQTAENIKIDMDKIWENYQFLKQNIEFCNRIVGLFDNQYDGFQSPLIIDELNVDGLLYDKFFSDEDRTNCRVIQAATPAELSNLNLKTKDDRLPALLKLYKARNFYQKLSAEEIEEWNNYRRKKLLSGGGKSAFVKYFTTIKELTKKFANDGEKLYLLEELRLYGESILPTDD